jgi:hypothetical protein
MDLCQLEAGSFAAFKSFSLLTLQASPYVLAALLLLLKLALLPS